MDIIIIANIINFIGILLCNIAYTMLCKSNGKNHNIVYMISSLIIVVGSTMLNSYPIVFLNVIWFFLCLFAYYEINYLKIKANLQKNYLYSLLGMGFVSSILSFYSHLFIDISAYFTSLIYIYSYILFTNNVISKKKYLIVSMIAILIVIPHLVLKNQYSVLSNEIYCFFISIYGLIKIKKEKLNFV